MVEVAEVAKPDETSAAVPKMGIDEIELEMKMIKVISKMPEKIQPRFKVLHMLSD